MQKDHPLFDDLAKLASSAAGTVTQVTREAEALVRAQVEKMLQRMNLVSREEFNVVRDMAAKARLEQEKLEARLADLEETLVKKK